MGGGIYRRVWQLVEQPFRSRAGERSGKGEPSGGIRAVFASPSCRCCAKFTAPEHESSRHQNMKELRIQHAGRPYRVLFAFDPKRCAILLTGGDKTGKDRWYEEFVPIADRLYDEHLAALEKEKKNNG